MKDFLNIKIERRTVGNEPIQIDYLVVEGNLNGIEIHYDEPVIHVDISLAGDFIKCSKQKS